VANCYIIRSFGILRQEKSGNRTSNNRCVDALMTADVELPE
jgi:hypothetical protein